ncbi:Bro-N domain-containing protein [bacterium MSK18_59]|nr:Bro-N domain-containing protein [bacterium MSK18_59]
MDKIEIFKNPEFGELTVTFIDGNPYFTLYEVGMQLGHSKMSKGVLYPRKDRIDNSVKNAEIIPVVHDGQLYIDESQMYELMLEMHTSKVKPFKKWLTSDVLPTIRKTGGYVNNDELFIDTYLPFADEQTKLLFSTTLKTVRNQNQLIESQKKEIKHKQEVINGLTDDIDIYTKRDVINRICRRRSGNYASRYKELYKCFKETFHIDLEKRCDGYNLKQPKKKDKLTVIKYAEQFDHIDDLYTCCVKLYEAEIDEVLDQINEIHSK